MNNQEAIFKYLIACTGDQFAKCRYSQEIDRYDEKCFGSRYVQF